MSVLIVIPCLNEALHIEALVRQIVTEPLSLKRRIVIADGGSSDGTQAIAQKLAAENPDIVYLHNPRRLQSAAINLAVAQYGLDTLYLIRLDAHAGYPANYCQALLDEAEATGADSVVVAMNTIGNGAFQSAVAAAQNSKLGNGGAAHRSAGGEGRWVDHGHHALMRIAAFTAVKGYDETFAHNEDAELDYRLTAAGYRLWLTGKTTIDYYPRSAPLPLLRQYRGYGFGRASTILKHHMRPKPRQLAPAVVVPAVILACLSPFFWLLAVPLLAWAWLCLIYGVALAIKAKRPVLALSGPAAMIMHFGWSLGFWRRIAKGRAA